MFAFLFVLSLFRLAKVVRLAPIQPNVLILATNNQFLQEFAFMIKDHFDLSCLRRTVYLKIMLENRLS